MSGKCDKCHEHCLDCKCDLPSPIIWVSKEEAKKLFPTSSEFHTPGESIYISSIPSININKEYFRDKFQNVFDDWQGRLESEERTEFIDELIKEMKVFLDELMKEMEDDE